MTHIYYDPSNDHVYRLPEGWFCLVDGRQFGPWLLKGYAEAGIKTEQRRAEKRRQKRAEEAAV